MEHIHESTESSSPIITRAVSAGLQNELIDNYEFPAWQRLVLDELGKFPQEVARSIISRFQAFSGLSPQHLQHFSLDQLIKDRIDDYKNLQGKHPAIVLGAGLGGATTYICLALNSPFLPQSFVISLKGGSYDGNAENYLNRTLTAALNIAKADDRLMTIQHFDPIHDGWLTKYVNHLRFKLIKLPDAYSDFIRTHIEIGGAVVFLDGMTQWKRYRVGERSVFQIGGWGDISDKEYLDGSQRISDYAKLSGLKTTNWQLNNKWPLENGPESEWGCEPGLADALKEFCKREGYRFVKVDLPHPNDFSRLAFSSAQKLLEKDKRSPSGTLVECFSQFDSTCAFRTGLLPLWLIFNTVDSAAYLKKMSKYFPEDKPIFFSGLSTFSITPDMAQWNDWVHSIGRDFISIGSRKTHYPSDARALIEWAKPLRAWASQNYNPIESRLTAEELTEIWGKINQID